MKIAIAIITKDRSKVAAKAISQHLKYRPEGARIIVVDDNSQYKEGDVDLSAFSGEDGIEYIYSATWLGVAGARNLAMELGDDSDVLFLMDDDIFPKKEGWADLYLQSLARVPKQHLLKAAPQPWAGIEMQHRNIYICKNTTATLFCMTRQLRDTLGGFDAEIGKYGYEDGDYYNRLARTDLAPYGPYCTPQGVEEYLHICDLEGSFEDLEWEHRSALHDTKQELLEESKMNIIKKYDNGASIYHPYISEERSDRQ